MIPRLLPRAGRRLTPRCGDSRRDRSRAGCACDVAAGSSRQVSSQPASSAKRCTRPSSPSRGLDEGHPRAARPPITLACFDASSQSRSPMAPALVTSMSPSSRTREPGPLRRASGTSSSGRIAESEPSTAVSSSRRGRSVVEDERAAEPAVRSTRPRRPRACRRGRTPPRVVAVIEHRRHRPRTPDDTREHALALTGAAGPWRRTATTSPGRRIGPSTSSSVSAPRATPSSSVHGPIMPAARPVQTDARSVQ